VTVSPLRLGPLQATGHRVLRSGVRWLVADGQYCPANRPIGFFNVSVEATSKVAMAQPLFADEMEVQVAIAPRIAGRLRLDQDLSRGGYLSIRTIEEWCAETVVAQIESDETPVADDAGQLRLLMLAGQRMTAMADVHGGLLPGWYGRRRGWWSEPGENPQTLLCLGVCDAGGVIGGDQAAFAEMFELARQSLQLVQIPDHPLAPCVPILLDQLERTPERYQAILKDVHHHFGTLSQPPSADDWLFLGTMLSTMEKSPLTDRYTVIGADGLHRLGPPDAVLLSLAVEPQSILRHKQLGYHVHVMRHHQAAMGPAVRAWLASAFEPVHRSMDAIRNDYETLATKLHRMSGTRILCFNRMSTSGHEDITNYMGFDAPLSDTLSNVAAKEMNLVLEDAAAAQGITVIDVDSIAAGLGGAQHVPDGIHQSGALQSILRQEVLNSLAAAPA